MNHMGIVLQVLNDHQLYQKFSKCKVWLRSLDFLCHIVSNKGIELGLKDMDAVKVGLNL